MQFGKQDGVGSNTYTVRAVHRVAGVLTDDAGPVELGTGKMSYDLKGEQSGTADVDEATGWTRSLTTTQTVGGSLRFQAAGGVPEVNNPITIQEKVTIEAVK